MQKRTVAFPHPPQKHGGPGSFQIRLEKYLKNQGWRIEYADKCKNPDVIFVVGGTRRLFWLLQNKWKGTKILLRLNGILWKHRVKWPGLKTWITFEINNLIVWFIRKCISDTVVYQSEFVVQWWHRKYGKYSGSEVVIYNGVDTSIFKNINRIDDIKAVEKIVCVEGNINDGISLKILSSIKNYHVDVYGNIPKEAFYYRLLVDNPNIYFKGVVSRDEIPEIYNGKCIFLSLDINAACPNSVVEALAAGIPIIGFDSGSIKELVGKDAGIVLTYGADVWKLEAPNCDQLDAAIKSIFLNYYHYSSAARNRAENYFRLDQMGDNYKKLL